MDKSLFEKLTRFAEETRKQLSVERVILFGSYARDEQRVESDIDVAVVVDSIPGSFLQASALLFKMSRSIDSLIEPKLVVASSESGFFQSIEKYGIIIYDNRKSA